jgi:hypothetical protein
MSLDNILIRSLMSSRLRMIRNHSEEDLSLSTGFIWCFGHGDNVLLCECIVLKKNHYHAVLRCVSSN